MCGIAGSLGPIDQRRVDAVRAMNGAQSHRGPNDEGLWSSAQPAESRRGVILGHRRLSIIDLSPLGHQPMVDEASGCVISYNGEVFNFADIRRDLEAANRTFRSSSDTEVILKAYAAYGEAFLTRLRGMFAIAIWDPRRKALLLARDRLGIKPLYWTKRGEGGDRVFSFASEVRSLLEAGEADRKIDPVGLATYLWNGVVVGPSTLIRGVSLLPAGTSMWVGLDGETTKPKPFWELPSAAAPATSAEAARAELRAELERAVKLRLLSDVPLGIFLSGGIDSSAIAALASRGATAPVRTCTITFDEARYDESPHARAVAQALKTDHSEVRLTADSFRRGLPDALEGLDQPTFDAINTYFVSRAVREAGLTVALAGTGGDELYGGYASFRDLPAACRAARYSAAMPEPLVRAGARLVTRLKTGPRGAVGPQTRWGKLSDALSTRGSLAAVYQVSYGLFTEEFLGELSEHSLIPGTSWGVPTERFEALEARLAGEPGLHAISMLELNFFLGERLLRDTDTASMAVSLEVRVPLIDHVVIEKLAAVPENDRFQPLGRKQLLRELALDGLDPSIFDRKKAGFELPLDVWCRQGLGADMDATLRDEGLCERSGLNPSAVRNLWVSFQEGRPGLYWSRVWSLYVLLWWCRRHGAVV